MSSVNKVILIGNVGGDVKIHTFNDGNKVANFSLATSETYTKKSTGEKVTDTEWHNVKASNKLAELCEKYVKKGSKLYCEGKIKTREYEVDGQKRFATEIQMFNMTFLSSNGNTTSEPQQSAPASAAPDDLPF